MLKNLLKFGWGLIRPKILINPDHDNVTVELVIANLHKNALKISVQDQGYGIAEPDISRIWDRLFRGDRSRSTQGAGLGLSIVRAVVTAHGGHVDACPNENSGTVFSVVLPRVPEDKTKV